MNTHSPKSVPIQLHSRLTILSLVYIIMGPLQFIMKMEANIHTIYHNPHMCTHTIVMF